MAFALFKHVFKLKEGEQLDLKVKLPEDNRGAVHGIVFDCKEKAVEDAVVKLFKVKHEHGKKEELCPVTHTFTDEHGQFLFGPLCPDEKYAIKIWVDGVCVKCEKVECGVCLKCLDCKCKHYCDVPCDIPGGFAYDEAAEDKNVYEEEREDEEEESVLPEQHRNNRRGY